MTNEDRKNTGIYCKFHVERVDGTSGQGKKHYGCEYFVLDLTHDPYAKAAILAYAGSCESIYPLLARDLRLRAQGVQF